MSSAAAKAFDANLSDIEQLIDYYDTAEAIFKDIQQCLPAGAEVVLREAIVLLVTYWEAYLEDIVSEALERLVAHTKDSEKLPKELRRIVAKEIKADPHELSPWRMAGEGWRQILKARLPDLREARNRSFNSPKSAKTREFVCAALGIADITQCWNVDSKPAEANCKRLDTLVSIRGKLVHRGKLPKPVTVRVIKWAKHFLKMLVSKTDGHINAEVLKATGQRLW